MLQIRRSGLVSNETIIQERQNEVDAVSNYTVNYHQAFNNEQHLYSLVIYIRHRRDKNVEQWNEKTMMICDR